MEKNWEPNLSMECRKNTQKSCKKGITEGNVTYEELKSGIK